MAYLTLYRKYRSQTFSELVGQDVIVRILSNAITQDRLSHAYLFSGPRGTGKTSTARILAKALNCEKGKSPTPCCVCSQCVKTTNGSAMDVVEIDAASNRGIDEMRELRERVSFSPLEGRYKIYIIDEVHMLTEAAFNALLKTLEEPPPMVLFILATTDPQKVPVTINSRCQRIEFTRVPAKSIQSHLKSIATKEGVKVDDEALATIARQSEGGMRDAISLLDQLISFKSDNITKDDILFLLGSAGVQEGEQLVRALVTGNRQEMLGILNDLLAQGKNCVQICRELVRHFRNLLYTHFGCLNHLDITAEQKVLYNSLITQTTPAQTEQALRILGRTEGEIRYQTEKQLTLEISLIETTALFSTKQSISEPAPMNPAQPIQHIHPAVKSNYSRITTADQFVPSTSVKSEPVAVTMDLNQKLGIAEIKHYWKDLLHQIKERKISLYMLITECEPIAIDGDVIVLSFKPGHTFHKEKLNEPNNKKLMLEVIEQIYKSPLPFKTIIGHNTNTGSSQGMASEPEPEISSANRIAALFEGKVVD